MRPPTALITVATLACATGLAVAQQAAIHPLLPPPGASATYMYVWDVSADGTWAVGYYQSAVTPFRNFAVRWPLAGPDAFIAQPLTHPLWELTSAGQVSGDGRIIVGRGRYQGSSSLEAFRWDAGSVSQVLSAGSASIWELTSDGVRMLCDNPDSSGVVVDGVTDAVVRTIPPGFLAMGMSEDGSVVVGGLDAFPYEAARSTAPDAMDSLCGLIGCGAGNTFTRPDSSVVSADGSTWAGVIRQPGAGYGGYAASLFLYRNGVLTTVPNQCGTYSEPHVSAANTDGSVLIGNMDFCESSSRAFYYSAGLGMQRLDALLSGAGVDLSAWTSLEFLRSVSADGRTVVGDGLTPGSNFYRPFAAIVPPACDSIDFNGDLLYPDTQDIADFLSVFAGGVCDGQQPGDTPCNSDIDFNNDTLTPDTDDIAALLRVFAGGSCAQ